MCAEDDDFRRYEARVRRYGYSWVRQNLGAAAVLARDPELRAAVSAQVAAQRPVSTDVIYRCDDRWLPERLDQHRKLIERLMSRSASGEEQNGGPVVGSPQAVILLGLPGSGKSSQLQPIARELIRRTSDRPHDVVDADQVRASFPEYADGLGSEILQVETAYVAHDRLLEEAHRQRANIILDTVGDPDRTVKELRYLIKAGWSVWCLGASVDLRIALSRARRRALRDGRYVPLDYIKSVGERPVRAFDAVRLSPLPVTGHCLLDTSGSHGSVPVVLKSSNSALFGQVGQPVAVWPRGADVDRGEL
jgi:predicted ABC-type ATPase